MSSKSATAISMPPKEVQPKNLPILREEDRRQDLFDALENADGVLTRACRDMGISFMALHRERIRDVDFARQVDLAVHEIRIRRSEQILAEADRHINSHLVNGWEYDRDELTGEVLLDHDFNPKRRSLVPIKSVVDARREMRSGIDGPERTNLTVNSVSNTQVSMDAPSRPRLVRPEPSVSEDILDAEIVTESPGGQE
jgi:hypothetical protein